MVFPKIPCALAENDKNSYTVMSSKPPVTSGKYPILPCASLLSFKIECPFRKASPVSGFNTPASIFIKVDLPAPLAPRMPINSPLDAEKEQSIKAFLLG